MRGSRKCCQRRFKSETSFFSFFLVDEGREDLNTTKSGPSSAHQQTTANFYYMVVRRSCGRSNMNHVIYNTEGHARAICWRANGGSTSNAVLVAL